MILIVFRHLIRPEYADDFPRIIGEFTAASRAEPGRSVSSGRGWQNYTAPPSEG